MRGKGTKAEWSKITLRITPAYAGKRCKKVRGVDLV